MDVVESKRLVIRICLRCELLRKNYPNVLTMYLMRGCHFYIHMCVTHAMLFLEHVTDRVVRPERCSSVYKKVQPLHSKLVCT